MLFYIKIKLCVCKGSKFLEKNIKVRAKNRIKFA